MTVAAQHALADSTRFALYCVVARLGHDSTGLQLAPYAHPEFLTVAVRGLLQPVGMHPSSLTP